MAPRNPSFFALVLLPSLVALLLPSCTLAVAGNVTTTSPSPSPEPSVPPPTGAGGVGRGAPGGGGGGRGSALDPRQLTALESMGLPFGRDPCASRDNATACDDGAPFRHLVALRLANCSSDLELSPTALRALSTLSSLSLVSCPIPAPRRLPLSLASSLRSFSCVSSLRRLSAVWLSRLQNLTDLAVVDVPVTSSGGPAVVLSHMRLLRSATLSAANLSGVVPHHWHSLGLFHLDLSSNLLRGLVPGSISVLTSLRTLNLSSNALDGTLPDSIGDLDDLRNASFAFNSLSGPIPDSLAQLSALEHLDLSSNQFNGSIPKFLANMTALKFLSLENNNFHGVLPFNASFLKKLEVFKVGGNNNLCYNRTLLSSKLELGIAPCNKYGKPLSPPPDKSSRSDSSDYSDDDGGDDSGADKSSGGGHHGPSKLVLGVAIGLSCFVFLVIFLVCLSKVCG